METKLALLYPSMNSQIIALVIEQAQLFVLDYCNISEIPDSLNSVVLDMCKQDLNKLNSEGFESENASGSGVNYKTDYTDNIYKRLKKHKRMKTL